MTFQLTDTLFKHFDILEKEESMKKQMLKQTIMQK